uniref:Uncharacterized protein n=1 Tax=Oscillatoriales cyanobacterium SpSt-402 TaxID=2282168 RepID=A0A832H1Y3_9CYAN
MAIKILERVMGTQAFASLGFTVGSTVIPVVIQVLQNEMTLEAGIAQVGYQSFTAAVITPIVLLFPPVGMALISAKVLQAIWAEISPEWKTALNQSMKLAMPVKGCIVLPAS